MIIPPESMESSSTFSQSTGETQIPMKKFSDKRNSNCKQILHNKMQFLEYQLLPQNYEDTKLKKVSSKNEKTQTLVAIFI